MGFEEQKLIDGDGNIYRKIAMDLQNSMISFTMVHRAVT